MAELNMLVVARTGFSDEVRKRFSQPFGAILEADDEDSAIQAATEKFKGDAARLNVEFHEDAVGATEIWSEVDYIGWHVDPEFYEI